MPLHLLGKKSWNVYNAEAIARVKRDEEEHAAREAAREQRDQEIDAARRLAFLRGEEPAPLLIEEEDDGKEHARSRDDDDWHRSERRRQRRRKGEDDTARDIRLAKEDQERGNAAARRLEASITDDRGHIQLFAEPKDAPKDKRDEEGPRLADAGGYDRRTPWYIDQGERKRKNAFGKDDEGRKDRDDKRMAGADPLAAMRGAQRAIKAKKEEDRLAADARDKARRMADEHRRSSRDYERRRSHVPSRHHDYDDLEGFSLDAPAQKTHRSHRHERHHDRRRRSRSPRQDRQLHDRHGHARRYTAT